MLDKAMLVSIFRTAFAPLNCVPELQNYEHAFGLAISMPDGVRLTRRWPNASLLLDENALEGAVFALRQEITARGVSLDPWSLASAN